ncbi:DUF1758 domain-containing protein [Nephila pilipes]|uniref:DUF1758 domain-containing protein n=1 Tax=Nephila pilipes TaxID=299642 RepID=A0A8X6NWB5_NEPPI|nr:DUF1758 domain-containing protein [Nephila pilipes]
MRISRKDLLIQIYDRYPLHIVMKNDTVGKDFPGLVTLYYILETKLRVLGCFGRTKEKLEDFLEPLAESCWPENVLRVWE